LTSEIVVAKLQCAVTYALALYLQGDVEKASQLPGGFSESSWNVRKLLRNAA
jgi:hypothetical protein